MSAEEPASPRSAKTPPASASYWLTRFLILRLLGIVYAVAFLVAANQLVSLIGSNGLLPLDQFVRAVEQDRGTWGGFAALPSLFWFAHSDAMLTSVSWVGFALSCVVVAGYANALLMLVLWALYMSIVHVGQLWYGYGWEIQLLETGFLAIFLCPLIDGRPFPRRAPPVAILWLYRWLIFRIMLGAGLIKIRGDEVWRNLTALDYHFETQPIPNPLSRWFHFLPRALLKFGVAYNHFAELVAPWFVFWPRLARHIAGGVIIAFQLVLILSGNLSFLNWLTIIPALACIDDSFWKKILPRALSRRAEEAATRATPSRTMTVLSWVVACVVAVLSWPVVANLVRPGQIMNTAFEPLNLVNTYGAFGTVGRERYNVVFEGTDDLIPDQKANWKPYLYKGLPVDVMKSPPQIAPYQLRLDWQMWFASMAGPGNYPFTFHLVWKLLHNDPGALSLFANNPFPEKPPRYIRAVMYKYSFAPPGSPDGRYWDRELKGLWLPPLHADNPDFKNILAQLGWLPPEKAK